MSKIRVHELAKEFGISSKEMEARIKDLGFPIKNYMSTLEDYEANEIRRRLHDQEEQKSPDQKVEAKPKKIIRRKHKVLHIKRIIKKSAPEETPAEEQKQEVTPTEETQSSVGTESVREEATSQEQVQPEAAKDEGEKAPEVKESKKEEEASVQRARIIRPAPKKEDKQEEKAPEDVAEPAKTPETAATKEAQKTSEQQMPKAEGPKEEEPVQAEAQGEAPKQEEQQQAVTAQSEGPVATQESAEPPKKDEALEEKQEDKKVAKAEEEETKAAGPTSKEKEGEETKRAPKTKEPKQFVKILQRPKIELKKEEKERPTEKKKDVSRPAPSATPVEDRPAKPSKPSKGKKKGKRVVKATDLGTLSKKRKPMKKKGKKETIREILQEEEGISRVGKKGPKSSKAHKDSKPSGTAPIKAGKRKITMVETIQVSELAQKMGVKVAEVIMKLMALGVMATANQTIDYDTAVLVASDFGYEVERKSVAEDIIEQVQKEVKGGEPVPRPPVVTIMGHVDHGKTTLLDAIRKTDVAAKEAGGITQHIGAYEVELPSGDQVVFLDTPGHEAFTSMRARGASVTDIVILVVAADDGVMAQTREAIDHARAAGVPIIVAVNKIDKPGANPDKVKTELSELGLMPEDWGGDTIFVNVSAKKGIGIDELLEMMVLQAEVLELKADPNRPATGYVIESKLDKGRGPVATLLVKEGTLHVGDPMVCGLNYGKVRAMLDDKGNKVDKAGPSKPVEVQGLSGVPEAGSQFIVLPNEKKAREVAEYRQRKAREAELAKSSRVSLETVFEKMKEQDLKVLHIIVKADVQGSLEALTDALRKLSTDKIKIDIVRGGIGAITESDVLLASASDAIIIGFNVKPTPKAKQLAAKEHVDIRFYNVIYHALEEVKGAMTGLLEPVYKEKTLGRAEVRQTFHIAKVGTVAGCYVLEGVIKRNSQARLLRDNVVVYTGKIESLRRFKDDVKEVQAGYECGIGLEKFNDIKVGDVIEAFEMEEIKPDLGTTIDGDQEKKDSEKE
ncbi:MAG: translation initiation factor IF-2 [Thermodesulfobacteria bacterium]|nr:translation initiation factor IF-2 [Thermodesulfobacteriota bacterium]